MCDSEVTTSVNLEPGCDEDAVEIIASLGLVSVLVFNGGAIFISLSPNLVTSQEKLDLVKKALEEALVEVEKIKPSNPVLS